MCDRKKTISDNTHVFLILSYIKDIDFRVFFGIKGCLLEYPLMGHVIPESCAIVRTRYPLAEQFSGLNMIQIQFSIFFCLEYHDRLQAF